MSVTLYPITRESMYLSAEGKSTENGWVSEVRHQPESARYHTNEGHYFGLSHFSLFTLPLAPGKLE